MSQQRMSESTIVGKHPPASPHGEIQQVFEGVWFVQGGLRMPMLMPMKIGRSMTIVRGDEGGLVLFNTMRLSEAGLAELDALGRVSHVVRIGGFHGRDDGFYRDRYGAKVLAVEGMKYVRALGKDESKSEAYLEPDEWLDEGSALPIAGARLRILRSSTPPEAICRLEREGGILITGDSLQHTPEPDQYFNWPAKMMMKTMKFFTPYNVGPGWLQFASPSAAEVRSILELDFEHVLPGHGRAVVGGAEAKYRPTIEGELKGCHD